MQDRPSRFQSVGTSAINSRMYPSQSPGSREQSLPNPIQHFKLHKEPTESTAPRKWQKQSVTNEIINIKPLHATALKQPSLEYLKKPKEPPKHKYMGGPLELSRGLVGLRNLGNTCFMNSVLQCLVHTPELYEFFSGQVRSEINSTNRLGGALALAFHEFIDEYRRNSRGMAISAYDIKYYIERIAPQFRGYSQHDSAEFLRALLDGLHQDLNRVKGKPVYREMTGDFRQGIERIEEEWWSYSLQRDNSLITDLFQGQLLSIISCSKCKEKTLSCDTFLDLTLTLPTTPSCEKVSVAKCFESLVRESSIPEYKCTSCKKNNCCTQEVTLYRLPKVLVIQLKRFAMVGYRRQKLNTEVDIPETLALSPYTRHSTHPTVKKHCYSLYGVSHHMGSLGFGHYIADCKDSGSWHCFDDARVSPSQWAQSSGTAYVLFYHQND